MAWNANGGRTKENTSDDTKPPLYPAYITVPAGKHHHDAHTKPRQFKKSAKNQGASLGNASLWD
jgi:hypothetical protein